MTKGRNMDVLNKICVVTGGARGIGKAIVDLFLSHGAKEVIACDVSAEDLKTFEGSAIRPQQLDITDSTAVSAFAQKLEAELGRVDVLVNNAGITRDALIQNMTDQDWDAVIAVNLKGAFIMTRALAPIMMKAGSGSIVSIASVVGIDGNVGQTNYAATKAGIIGMTKSWAKEFARKGALVRANAVAPGFINTPMIRTVPEKVIAAVKDKTVLKRLGEPEDIARAVLFFASDYSSFITGQVLRVDGGLIL